MAESKNNKKKDDIFFHFPTSPMLSFGLLFFSSTCHKTYMTDFFSDAQSISVATLFTTLFSISSY